MGLSEEERRHEVALRMVQVLPGYGSWASSIRDFETPYGRIGMRQLSILYVMRYPDHPSVDPTPRFLAQKFNVQPSVITRSLARLEEHGFIERVKDATDRRVARLSITELGQAVSVYVEEIFVREMLTSISSIDNDRLEELAGWIETLADVRADLGTRRMQGSSDPESD